MWLPSPAPRICRWLTSRAVSSRDPESMLFRKSTERSAPTTMSESCHPSWTRSWRAWSPSSTPVSWSRSERMSPGSCGKTWRGEQRGSISCSMMCPWRYVCLQRTDEPNLLINPEAPCLLPRIHSCGWGEASRTTRSPAGRLRRWQSPPRETSDGRPRPGWGSLGRAYRRRDQEVEELCRPSTDRECSEHCHYSARGWWQEQVIPRCERARVECQRGLRGEEVRPEDIVGTWHCARLGL